jgi:hypothetical protein
VDQREHYAYRHEPWRAEAACKGHPTSWWFPERGGSNAAIKRAVAICNSCTVKDDCLESALVRFEQGIWGGINIRDRRELRDKRQIKKQLVCQHCRTIYTRTGAQAGINLYCSIRCKKQATSIQVMQRRNR